MCVGHNIVGYHNLVVLVWGFYGFMIELQEIDPVKQLAIAFTRLMD